MAGTGGPMELNGKTFDKFVKGNRLAAVDFWAPWCGPCKMMGPTFEAVSKAYSGKVAFGKVNVDDSQDIAASFGVMSIPTILFFKSGQVVHTTVGAVPKDALDAEIRKHLL